MELIRVLLVDDHAVVREGYRRLLEATDRIAVVAEADNGEDAYRRFLELAPDVVVMDISLPGIGGLEVLRRVLAREPAAQVLMFSMHEDPVFVSRALERGARGYLTKASAPEMMVEAVLSIADGRRFIAPDVAQILEARRSLVAGSVLDPLTEREFEVLRLLIEGRSVPEIADLMCLSAKTISNYQTAIRQKIGAETPMQLLRAALANGLIDAAALKLDVPPPFLE
jgi:two-component system invasion response regulator UvrY